MSEAPGGAAPTAPAAGGAAPGAGAMCPCGGCGVSWSFSNGVVWRFLKVQVGLTNDLKAQQCHGILIQKTWRFIYIYIYVFCFCWRMF